MLKPEQVRSLRDLKLVPPESPLNSIAERGIIFFAPLEEAGLTRIGRRLIEADPKLNGAPLDS